MKAPQRTITYAKDVKLAAAPAAGWLDYRDTKEAGLTLRVFASGAKSWVTKIPTIVGPGKTKGRRMVLGQFLEDADSPGHMSLEEARDERRARKKMAEGGADPTNKARRVEIGVAAENTFGALTDAFLSERRIRPSTVTGYKTAFAAEKIADWNDRPITHISKHDVKAAIAHIRKQGHPVAANRAVMCLRAFFKWAVESEHLTESPAVSVKRIKEDEVERQTVLEPSDIRELWTALQASSRSPIADIFKLLLLTGARKREIADLQWSEVRDLDGDDPRIELPPSRYKTGSKAGSALVIRLNSLAVTILKAQPRVKGRAYVFRQKDDKRVLAWTSAKNRINRRIAKARAAAGNEDSFVDWTPHDFRRTLRTRISDPAMRHFLNAVREGDRSIPWHISERLLGHSIGKIEKVYNVADLRDDIRTAIEAWGQYVEAIVGNCVDEVVRGDVVSLAASRKGVAFISTP